MPKNRASATGKMALTLAEGSGTNRRKALNSQEIRDAINQSGYESEDMFGTDDEGDVEVVATVGIPGVGGEERDEAESEEEGNTSGDPIGSDPLGVPEVKRKKGGRAKDSVWDEYIEEDKRGKKFSCKHCEKIFSHPQPDRLRKHLQQCKSYCRKTAVQNVNSPTVRVPAETVVRASDGKKVEETSDFSQSSCSSAVSSASIKRKQPKVHELIPPTSEAKKRIIDEKLMRWICHSNQPFSEVDNAFFKDFISELRPTYSLPGRKDIGGKMLDEVYDKEFSLFTNQIKGKVITIMQDGWTSPSREQVIAHTIMVEKKVHLFKTHVMGEQQKTAENCLKLLYSAIVELESEFGAKVVGCITDNCSTMQKMRRDLHTRRPDIVEYGCNAHLLNLVGKKFTPEEPKNLIVKVQNYFSNRDIPRAALLAIKGNAPKIPCDTRWNSQLGSFESYINNHAKYLEISRRNGLLNDSSGKEVRNIINDLELYRVIQDTVTTLTPIARCLDFLQGNNATSADAVSCWLTLSVQLGSKAMDDYFVDQMILGTPSASVAAYTLHPKYRGEKLTPGLREDARKYITKKDAKFLPVVLAFQSQDLSYFSGHLFSDSVIQSLDPVSWWRVAHTDNPDKISEKFLKMAENLLRLPASTAAIERDFSTMKNTITDKRNQLSMPKVEKICFLNSRFKEEAKKLV